MRRLLIVVVMSGFASGCGGGDAVAKEEFIVRAEAICSRANDKVGGRPKAGDVFEVNRPDAYRRVLRYYANFVAAEQSALNKLGALEVPRGDEKDVRTFLAAFDRTIGYAEQSLAALRARDLDDFRNSKRINALFRLTSEVELRAAEYGFEDCTQLGIR